MTDVLCYLPLAAAGALIRERKLSPVELTRALLDRIERYDGELHAFITLTGERALAQARAAEAEIAGGAYRGPLHGIPVGLKDIYETAGVATTAHALKHRAVVDHLRFVAVHDLADDVFAAH